MAVFTSVLVLDADLSLRVGAGGRMRQFLGSLQAGSEVLSVFSVVEHRVLLHESVAMEQLLLPVSRARGDQ